MPDPLTPTQRLFLVKLGIRGAGSVDLAKALIEEYELKEHVVITAIKELTRLGVSPDWTSKMSAAIQAVQASMRGSGDYPGPLVLRLACDDIERIHRETLLILPRPMQAYFSKWAQVAVKHGKLRAKLIAREAHLIAGLIQKAHAEAANSRFKKAVAMLDQAEQDCKEAEQLLLDYLKKVGSAVLFLKSAAPSMSAFDVMVAELALSVAAGHAEVGERAQAEGQVAQIERICREGARAAGSAAYREATELAHSLEGHPASANFADALRKMIQTLARVRKATAAKQGKVGNDNSQLGQAFARVRKECLALRGLMDKHMACENLRVAAKHAVETLRRFDPAVTSAGIQALLERSAQAFHAARLFTLAHEYDAVHPILNGILKQCLEGAPAACNHRIQTVGLAATKIPSHKLFVDDANAVKRLLAAAKAAATSSRYVGASALLNLAQNRVDAAQELWGKVEAISSAMQAIAEQMNHDPSGALTAARTFFNALKARVSQAEFAQRFQEIESLFEQAGKALSFDPGSAKEPLRKVLIACGSAAATGESQAAFEARCRTHVQPQHASIEADPAVDPASLMKLRAFLDNAHAAAQGLRFDIASNSLDDAVVLMVSIQGHQLMPT